MSEYFEHSDVDENLDLPTIEQNRYATHCPFPESLRSLRLDQALSALLPEYSRSQLQKWLKDGQLQLFNADKQPIAPKANSKDHAVAFFSLQLAAVASLSAQGQDLPLTIVYEDDALLIIDKPAGFTVHPGAGQADGTLLNALLFHRPALAELPRAGLVHRLDKDTSGLLMVAKTPAAQTSLTRQLQEHRAQRQYFALVQGEMSGGGTVDKPIGRHPRDRLKQAVLEDGRPAITHYRLLERLPGLTALQVQLETGRTHQIRVHLASIHHPIVGDNLYGAPLRGQWPSEYRQAIQSFPRQVLHASALTLAHPDSGMPLTFHSSLPKDITDLLDFLRKGGR
jgi:23S rRNA pseudouridine1911/1915/1917 synthase